MKHLTLLLLSCCAIFCRAPRHTADQLPDNQIRWGQSGGFTNKTTTFILLENGQIFKKESLEGTTLALSATKSKTAKSLFNAIVDLSLNTISSDHPGNMTYFLEIQDKTSTHRIAWGDKDFPIEQKVLDFYSVLQQLVKPEE